MTRSPASRNAVLHAAVLAAFTSLAPAAMADDDHGWRQDRDGRRHLHQSGPNQRPWWLREVRERRVDGITDDLLTAGLGASGLASATPPGFANPAAPTATELRRLAIYTNYRALADMTEAGGYGRFWGPNLDLQGGNTLGEGKVPGVELLAYADRGDGRENVTLMVQIPDSFDARRPCIVAAPSSGSRGVYGAIGTSGEWALKRGCAVAYTDKGTGNGAHDLTRDRVTLIDGTLASADAAGRDSHFTAPISDAERETYAARFPERYAFKHAHSRLNPERHWGRDTLRSIEFAFWAINRQLGAHGRKAVMPRNTTVIAASVSNGGGAVLMAAEQDDEGLIDGVVATEPQVHVDDPKRLVVRRGGAPVAAAGLPLYDYVTAGYLYQPCAALSADLAGSPFAFLIGAAPQRAQNRCTALKEAGLIQGNTMAELAAAARQRLREAGYEPESDPLLASHFLFNVTPAVSVTYANAYARASVTQNLCGYSMGTVVGQVPGPAVVDHMRNIFSVGNGVPPTNGIQLIFENAVGGAALAGANGFAVSPSTNRPDYEFDGVRCLRGLLADRTVRKSIEALGLRGDLQGRPTMIVHGRADALIPVNNTSRPYMAATSLRRAKGEEVRYVEVTNAQHFEAFLPLAGYAQAYLPLHVYSLQALDAMWERLTRGRDLPPSQVVRTVPRGLQGLTAARLEAANLPAIRTMPAAADRILVKGGVIDVPN